MVRHRAAGPRVDDLLERLVRAHNALELPPRGLVTARVRDEDAVAIDVVAALEPLLDVLHVALFELAAVLVADAHLAVLDLDARLELQKVRAHGDERRTAPALLQVEQRVDDEARLDLFGRLAHLPHNVLRRFARGGALGDCLAAVLDAAGYDVWREFYVNDAGNQIEKFALSLEVRYLQHFLGEDAIELPEDSYHGDDIRVRAEEFAAVFGDRYVNADEAERRQALVDFALPKNIAGMQETLAKYRIQYDNWFYESTVHQDGELAETIELFRQAGLTYEKDGALWYKATERGAEKDEVLVRANGNPTYFAADVAYHRNKLVKRGYDQAIDIWGADHHGHVARMKGALEAIGIDPNRLDVILMQLVRLVSGGEVVRMSKRTGKAITLTDLLDDIPVDAARFLFNLREPGSQMEFDLDLAVEQSAQNPVYYCQYAHARICSILKKLASEGVAPRECTGQELCLLATPEERALIRHLAALTDEIVLSAKNYDPARITRYVIELATLFHKFYNACRVRVEDEALMQARIYLCICVRDTIRNILEMLKIMVPESM